MLSSVISILYLLSRYIYHKVEKPVQTLKPQQGEEDQGEVIINMTIPPFTNNITEYTALK